MSPIYFYLKKNLATFFISRQFYGIAPVYFLLKTGDLFLLITVTFFHSSVTHLEGVIPHLFYLSDLVLSIILCKDLS